MGHDLTIIAIESCQNFDNQLPLLEAGIDVILSQPLGDALLLARVRSLVRSNSSDSDWELGAGTSHALGFAEAQKVFVPSGRAVLGGRTGRYWRIGRPRRLVIYQPKPK